MTKDTPPLALYIHWPFCQKKCPYCDFNSHVREKIDERVIFKALKQDFLTSLQWLEDKKPTISSIFFGGGTPSLMSAKLVEDILALIANHSDFTNDIEITLEANPSSYEAKKFQDFKIAGVNRLSLGVQSFDDEILAFLGRIHDCNMAIKAIASGHKIFDHLSFDLIYGINGVDDEQWQNSIDKAMSLAGDHISLYQLTIEAGTNFMTRHKKGEILTLSEQAAARQYEMTLNDLQRHNMPAYEISNFAKPQDETGSHQAKHNLAYWRYQPYLGIGPGAHSRLIKGGEVYALSKVRLPEIWAKQTETSQMERFCKIENLTNEEKYLEILLMGLRLFEGLPESRLLTHTNLGFNHLNQMALDDFIQEGWLKLSLDSFGDNRLSISNQGAIRLDGMLASLMA